MIRYEVSSDKDDQVSIIDQLYSFNNLYRLEVWFIYLRNSSLTLSITSFTISLSEAVCVCGGGGGWGVRGRCVDKRRGGGKCWGRGKLGVKHIEESGKGERGRGE